MSYTFEYYFDDLELVKGLSVYASGVADVQYARRPKDPEVGIFEPYIDDIEINSIKVYASSTNDKDQTIDSKHWLYPLIEAALLDGSSLEQACIDDYDD
jgi:hypothetical protein